MTQGALPRHRNHLNKWTFVLMVLTTFVVLLLGVLAWFEARAFKAVLIARNQEQLQYIARSEATHIEDSFNAIVSLLEVFATSPPIKKRFRENMRGPSIPQRDYYASEEILSRLHWIADSVYLIDSQGVVLERAPFKEGREGSDYATKPGIAAVLKYHKTHVSEIFLAQSGAPFITVCVPVFEENSLIGILRALLYLPAVKKIVGPIKVGEHGYTQILDMRGKVIFHPEHAYIGQNIVAMKKEEFPAGDWSGLDETVKNMSDGDAGVAVYRSVRHAGAETAAINEVAAFTPIAIRNQSWSLMVVMDDAEIAQLIARHTVHAYGVAGILMVIFIAGSGIIYRFQKKQDVLEMSIRSAEALEQANQQLKREVDDRKALEAESRKKSGYLKTIIESLTHPFYVIDAENYTITIANSTARKQGITEASTCYRLTHHRDTPCEGVENPCPLQETKRTKKPVTVEHVHYDSDGNPRIFLVHGFPLFDDKGSVIQMIEYSLDITDSKKAEQELEKTKDNLDNIIESSLDPIVIVDTSGCITRVNGSFLQMLGYGEEEVIGRHTTEFSPSVEGSYESTTGKKVEINEDVISQSREMFAKLFEEGKIYNWERYFVRKDQKIVPVESNIVFLFDREGNMTGGVGILRDITARKKAEEESTEARNFLENIFETSADGIMVTDEQGCIVKINPAIEQMLGYGEDELVGKYTSELGTQDEKRVQTRAVMFEQLFEKGYVKHWETEWYRKDGSLCPVEINITFLKDRKGTFYRAVAGIRDISERKEAEALLRESEEQLGSLVQTANDAILTINPSGEIESWNNGAHAIFGYTSEEIIGRSFSCLVPERCRENNRQSMEKLLATNRDSFVGRTFSFPGIRKDGSEFPAEISYASYKAKKGMVLTGIVRDITERQKAEQEIREARNFLENIFKTVTDGILVTDNEGTISVVNDAIARMLGYAKEEIIGEGAHIFKPEGDDHEVVATNYLERLFAEGTVTGFEFSWLKKDRSLIDVEVNAALLRNDDGTVTGAVSTIRDITERKEFEERLKKSEDKYRGLITHANDAIITVNREGIIIDYNETAEKIFGYSADEIVGKPGFLLLPVAEREKWQNSIEQFKDKPAVSLPSKTSEKRGLRKDGKEIFVESSTFSLKTHGEYLFTSIVRDVTERKEMEYKLLQSEKLKSLGELAGGVAHDFNNVLAAILGRAQLLKLNLNVPTGQQEKRKSVYEIKNGLDIIEKAAMDGAETVRRIQEFARKRTDDKDFVQVNINELLDNALEFTRVKWKDQTESKGIKIHIQKEFSPLPPTLGSASELREVFTNIINNAVDAMPQGGELGIKTVNGNKQIMIMINDTGVGIPKGAQDRIFDPFFTTKGVQSTGLGMSVSYGIINRHQGTIKVDSMEGAGTTFTITLPLAGGAGKEVEPALLQQEKQRKAHILVIEDEREVRKLLTDILLSGGEHEVESTSDGSQGIELFKSKRFDMVFTDLGMPGMSGWEVAEAVKSINPKVPVAIITGWNVDLQESEMEERGVDLIAYKPFEVNRVLELVQEGMKIQEKFRAA